MAKGSSRDRREEPSSSNLGGSLSGGWVAPARAPQKSPTPSPPVRTSPRQGVSPSRVTGPKVVVPKYDTSWAAGYTGTNGDPSRSLDGNGNNTKLATNPSPVKPVTVKPDPVKPDPPKQPPVKPGPVTILRQHGLIANLVPQYVAPGAVISDAARKDGKLPEHCKARPEDNRPNPAGGGGGKKFVPWRGTKYGC